MKKAFPILAVLTALFLAYAFYQAMFVAPTDAAQGEVYRIIYYHVPSAWTAFLLFFVNFLASVQYLASAKASSQRATNWVVIAIGIIGFVAPFIPQVRQQLPTGMYPSSVATTALILVGLYFLIGKYFPGQNLDVLAVTAAEVGVVFCTIVLVTGPIWARPVWGIWCCVVSRTARRPRSWRRCWRCLERSMSRWFISRSGSSARSTLSL